MLYKTRDKTDHNANLQVMIHCAIRWSESTGKCCIFFFLSSLKQKYFIYVTYSVEREREQTLLSRSDRPVWGFFFSVLCLNLKQRFWLFITCLLNLFITNQETTATAPVKQWKIKKEKRKIKLCAIWGLLFAHFALSIPLFIFITTAWHFIIYSKLTLLVRNEQNCDSINFLFAVYLLFLNGMSSPAKQWENRHKGKFYASRKWKENYFYLWSNKSKINVPYISIS